MSAGTNSTYPTQTFSEGTDRLGKHALAALVAADIPTGAYVNLGIGQPTSSRTTCHPQQHVTLHTENGMLGMGPAAQGDDVDLDLINAGKIPVTEQPGASYFHHADSFAMMRGGHLDICVLGAYQVAANGDLANWHTGDPDDIPAVGGAMDLALGAKETYVMMSLLTRDGGSQARRDVHLSLTGVGCVTRVYTDVAVFLIRPKASWSARRTGCRSRSSRSSCPCRGATASPAATRALASSATPLSARRPQDGLSRRGRGAARGSRRPTARPFASKPAWGRHCGRSIRLTRNRGCRAPPRGRAPA